MNSLNSNLLYLVIFKLLSVSSFGSSNGSAVFISSLEIPPCLSNLLKSLNKAVRFSLVQSRSRSMKATVNFSWLKKPFLSLSILKASSVSSLMFRSFYSATIAIFRRTSLNYSRLILLVFFEYN